MSQIYPKHNENLMQESWKCIDQKTRQVLFFECNLQLIKQIFLKNSEKFTEQQAINLLEKYVEKRRKSKCTAYFLLDRIRFQQKKSIGIKPFRKEVIYREIKHFFVFPNYPHLFMICIVDESKHKRSYELYQCINYNDVCTVCNLTYKASIDIGSSVLVHGNRSNRHNEKQIIKTELVKSTSNLPTKVNQSFVSYNSKLNHSKFYSTDDVFTNKSGLAAEQINSVKGDESFEYSMRKQQINCSSSNITRQNAFLENVIVNKLCQQKPYTTSSFSSTSSGEYDVNGNVYAKQDMSSINYNNSKLQNTETNSTF
ncbi:hypothetical protein EWB00_005449 [Schistosoma japonicum]|uniref:Trematode PH-like domain-containing protein n=1 Tax=Schistosoma japonicum TaxID=6182 RepID=A0A4Z2DU77_SCHJA|nr:hypothetical protein EWB00_005449 [Schistosoma japonicum]